MSLSILISLLTRRRPMEFSMLSTVPSKTISLSVSALTFFKRDYPMVVISDLSHVRQVTLCCCSVAFISVRCRHCSHFHLDSRIGIHSTLLSRSVQHAHGDFYKFRTIASATELILTTRLSLRLRKPESRRYANEINAMAAWTDDFLAIQCRGHWA